MTNYVGQPNGPEKAARMGRNGKSEMYSKEGILHPYVTQRTYLIMGDIIIGLAAGVGCRYRARLQCVRIYISVIHTSSRVYDWPNAPMVNNRNRLSRGD